MSNYMDKPSAKYTRAVEALLELLKSEGSDAVTRAYAETTHEIHKKQFAERPGVNLSKSRYACIHRLMGKRCPNERCAFGNIVPAADHLSEWKKDGKTFIIVSQPYGLNFESLKKTVKFCEANELEATIDARLAWYFPGSVISVEYTQADKSKVNL